MDILFEAANCLQALMMELGEHKHYRKLQKMVVICSTRKDVVNYHVKYFVFGFLVKLST